MVHVIWPDNRARTIFKKSKKGARGKAGALFCLPVGDRKIINENRRLRSRFPGNVGISIDFNQLCCCRARKMYGFFKLRCTKG